MNGKSPQKITSKAFPIDRTLVEVLFLLFLGAFAVVLRAKLRIPLNMPGHHGMEVMALFLIGRNVSNIRFASSISSIAAALFIFFPFMGFKDPFLPVIYIIMGVSIDILYRVLYNEKFKLISMAIVGGIAYMLIPLSRIIINLSIHYPYQSLLKWGYFYPIISHFIFGLTGALLAFTLIYTTKKIRN